MIPNQRYESCGSFFCHREIPRMDGFGAYQRWLVFCFLGKNKGHPRPKLERIFDVYMNEGTKEIFSFRWKKTSHSPKHPCTFPPPAVRKKPSCEWHNISASLTMTAELNWRETNTKCICKKSHTVSVMQEMCRKLTITEMEKRNGNNSSMHINKLCKNRLAQRNSTSSRLFAAGNTNSNRNERLSPFHFRLHSLVYLKWLCEKWILHLDELLATTLNTFQRQTINISTKFMLC